MFIHTETTPNPNAVKFMPGNDVSPERTFDFRTPEEAMTISPLGKMLFEIGSKQSKESYDWFYAEASVFFFTQMGKKNTLAHRADFGWTR